QTHKILMGPNKGSVKPVVKSRVIRQVVSGVTANKQEFTPRQFHHSASSRFFQLKVTEAQKSDAVSSHSSIAAIGNVVEPKLPLGLPEVISLPSLPEPVSLSLVIRREHPSRHPIAGLELGAISSVEN